LEQRAEIFINENPGIYTITFNVDYDNDDLESVSYTGGSVIPITMGLQSITNNLDKWTIIV